MKRGHVMGEEAKAARRAAIEAAALTVLEARGYAETSMLAVARAAKASNETLYNWYGDKLGLFRALVARNAGQVAEVIEGPLEAALGRLLTMLTSREAVVLNRAAAADASGVLGQALAEAGREAVMARLVERIGPEADLLLRLVIGDWQIRRLTGAMAEPAPEEIAARVAEALDLWLILKQARG